MPWCVPSSGVRQRFPACPVIGASMPPVETVAAAKRLHERMGKALLEEPALRLALGKYRVAIRRTGDSMQTCGVVAACAACAVHGPGSCCFQDIQHCYDPVHILINLLLGCEVPDRAEKLEECFFLGKAGCLLAARHAFCLNYLCPSLQESLDPDVRMRLLSTVGEELDRGWKLELIIRRFISRQVTRKTGCVADLF